MFEIMAKYYVGLGSAWEPLPHGNEFPTEAEAWEAIDGLRELGGEWAAGEYDVRPVERLPPA